ncbi:MAG: hypothetical protein JWL86_6669 [Rhizobium sp.]|nr:hypothetical protein [Rhizobium sp.]
MEAVMDKTTSPLGPEGQFWAHLREGRLMIQRSRSTGAYVFYPRLIAPRSGADDLEFTEVSGAGTVYSTTTIRRPAKHGGDHNVCVVDLDEGVRMLSRVVGCAPDEVHIGMRVQAAIEPVDFGTYANSDQPIVLFRLAGAQS